MVVQQTTIEAWQDVVRTSKNNQEIVLNTLKVMGEANNLMIARRLNWPINRVTPRVNELVKANFIEESYRDACPYTKRTTIFWRVCQ